MPDLCASMAYAYPWQLRRGAPVSSHLVARLVLSIPAPQSARQQSLGRVYSQLTNKLHAAFPLYSGLWRRALDSTGLFLQHPGADRQWETRPKLGKALQGLKAECQVPASFIPPKQPPIVPVAPKFPEVLPEATLSWGHSLSKGPQAGCFLLDRHGGPRLIGVPGYPRPTENSQPRAWQGWRARAGHCSWHLYAGAGPEQELDSISTK